jgi:selenocysteine-specific elongation factor
LDSDLLRYLVASGRAVDAGGGVVFEAGAFGSAVDLVSDHIEQHGSVTLAEVRDLLSTTRKYAQPLLEEMDRRRLTRRVGEGRVLYLQPASPSRTSG